MRLQNDVSTEKDFIHGPANSEDKNALGWQLAQHACRFCLGRVLIRQKSMFQTEVQCAECGASAIGEDHKILCCCGAQCGSIGKILECYENPNVSNTVPQCILVRERVL